MKRLQVKGNLNIVDIITKRTLQVKNGDKKGQNPVTLNRQVNKVRTGINFNREDEKRNQL